MNEIQSFTSERFGLIRIVDRDGEPWFVAKDVCECLGVVNSRDAVARLDDNEKDVGKADTLGGSQDMTLISESGLYALIMRSNKQEAKCFRRALFLHETAKYRIMAVDIHLLWHILPHQRTQVVEA